MYRMNKAGLLLAVAFVALLGVSLASAQTNVTMLGYPQGVAGPVLAGVYTSPYYANVGASQDVPIICDDFVNDTFFSESWTAYVTSLSAVPGTTVPTTPDSTGAPDFNTGWSSTTAGPEALEFNGGYNVGAGTGSGLNQVQAYLAAAYLAVEILQQNQLEKNGQPLTIAGGAEDLSYAMWALFDPAVFIDQNNGALGTCTLGSYGCLPSSDFTNAENDLKSAVALVTGGTLTQANFDSVTGAESVNILTFDKVDTPGGAPNCSGSACPDSPPQEFIQVTMPEPSALSLLGVDLLGALGLALFVRRRWAGSVPRS